MTQALPLLPPLRAMTIQYLAPHAENTRQRTQGPRGGLVLDWRDARRLRWRQRRSRSMTRRKAWRHEELQNRWQGLRWVRMKYTSQPGRSQKKISSSPGARWPSRVCDGDATVKSGVAEGAATASAADCRRSAQRHRYCRLWAWRFARPLGVCRYCRLARLRRHRRAAT